LIYTDSNGQIVSGRTFFRNSEGEYGVTNEAPRVALAFFFHESTWQFLEFWGYAPKLPHERNC